MWKPSETGCYIRLTLPQCILCSQLPHVSYSAGTGSNGWHGAVKGGAASCSQSCNTAEAPDPAVCVFSSPAGMRLIRRPTHGHACGVVLLQSVGVVTVGCVFEARRPGRLRLMSPLMRQKYCPGCAHHDSTYTACWPPTVGCVH